jgi:transglutaminase-like putative cysteine protease
MQLECEISQIDTYLREDEIINYSHPLVRQAIQQLQLASESEVERVQQTFEFVRDTIPHSWDAQNPQVTCTASEVLQHQTGICYAKSHLLAALLRGQGIPTGFCYQRLTLGDTPETGYSVHALNAAYLPSLQRWIRLDARGNKPGVQAEFSLEQEKLAFPVRPELDEIDYPTIYSHPHPKVVAPLQQHSDSLYMYQHCLPGRL